MQTVDAYISGFPKETQEKLQEIQSLIRKELPDADEVISYGVPTFKIDGKYIIYFAGFKNHISIYPASDRMVKAISEAGKYRTGKGTLQFSLLEPLPLPLIKKVVHHLIAEFKERQNKK
jgi:uncharacterized protein YdhG (YjbR/CyaY superfamily)